MESNSMYRWMCVGQVIAMALCLLVFSGASAQQAGKRLLLGISKTDHMLVVIDPVTLKTITRIPIGEDPHEVTTSADGKTAYVSNTGFGVLHEINVIDLVGLKPLKNIDTRPLYGPHGLSFTGGKLWFTAQGSKAVGRYNPATDSIEWSMGTGQNTTHLLHVTTDERQIYTTNVESGTVSIFEHQLVQPAIPPTGKLSPNAKPRMDWLQTLIPVGQGAEGFDVSPSGKELWTIKPDGNIVIVDIAEKKIATTIEAKVLGLHRLAFTPDGHQVIIVSVRTGDLLVYDAITHKEIKRMQIGQGAGIMIDAAGNRAFISCTPNNYIVVFDLKTLTVTGHLEIGGRPDGMAIVEQ